MGNTRNSKAPSGRLSYAIGSCMFSWPCGRTVLTCFTIGLVCWAYCRCILCWGIWQGPHERSHDTRRKRSPVTLSEFEGVQGPRWGLESTNPCLGCLHYPSMGLEDLHVVFLFASHVCIKMYCIEIYSPMIAERTSKK
jgi:hypothetical protein